MQLDILQTVVSTFLTVGALFAIVKMFGGFAALWDVVDISENLNRLTRQMRQVPNGPQSLLYAVVFAFPAVVGTSYLAWVFDLHSSWAAMDGLRKTVEQTVPEAHLILYGFFIFAILTYLPSLIELFSGTFARANIAILQVLVIVLAIFDLATDLPRVQEFVQHYYPTFVNSQNSYLVNIAFQAVYNLFFALFLVLASYGFELLAILFGWLLVGMVFKSLKKPTPVSRGGGRAQQANRRTTTIDEAGNVVE